MKKKYKLKKWVKYTLSIIIIMMMAINLKAQSFDKNTENIKEISVIVKESVEIDQKNADISVENVQKVAENAEKEVENVKKQEEIERKKKEEAARQAKLAKQRQNSSNNQGNVTQSGNGSVYTTRLTSYYANDGYGTGSTTGSGLKPANFGINEHGWYTYQGKLVVATATTYLLKYGYSLSQGVHTYKYYNELTLTIDGVDYRAIVLDSCGSCMKNGRIDLFVSNKQSVKDTTITVKED